MGIGKDFWPKSTVAVLGSGSFGTVLANLVSFNCRDVKMWVRQEEQARSINSTRTNPRYVPNVQLTEKVKAFTHLERIFETPVHAVIWALPSSICRVQAKEVSRFLKGDEIILHATKGIEEKTLKRISEILRDELPCPRIGVISGPNLASEIANQEPAATVIASAFDDVIEAGQELLGSAIFKVYSARDMVGVEWAGALKNILAIASGALDAMGYGWNARAMLITRGLAEMVRFGVAMGAEATTFLGLAGAGDLLATCSSPLSRNYRVGGVLSEVLQELGSTAEGVKTTQIVWEFAKERGIDMPITEGVYKVLQSGESVGEVLRALMVRNQTPELSQ